VPFLTVFELEQNNLNRNWMEAFERAGSVLHV